MPQAFRLAFVLLAGLFSCSLSSVQTQAGQHTQPSETTQLAVLHDRAHVLSDLLAEKSVTKLDEEAEFLLGHAQAVCEQLLLLGQESLPNLCSHSQLVFSKSVCPPCTQRCSCS